MSISVLAKTGLCAELATVPARRAFARHPRVAPAIWKGWRAKARRTTRRVLIYTRASPQAATTTPLATSAMTTSAWRRQPACR